MRNSTLKNFLVLVAMCFCFAGVPAEAEEWFCPMKCEGEKTYPAKQDCPVCGMHLEKKTEGTRPLNTRDYRVDVSPAQAKAGQKTKLTLTVRKTKDNSVVKDLEVVHDKVMHLIVVTQELDWFAHEHPVAQPDGSLTVEVTFPRGGNYVLYADLTPKGDRNQVFPLAMQVEGDKGKPAPLKPNLGQKRKVGDYTVSLSLSPGPVAEKPVTFKYRVQKKGKDVKDLQPYLGALGHNVTLSEDTTTYLHAHPPGGHDHHGHGAVKGGPEVQFMTTFPRPGLYKSWSQFQHEGKVLTFDYVLKVK